MELIHHFILFLFHFNFPSNILFNIDSGSQYLNEYLEKNDKGTAWGEAPPHQSRTVFVLLGTLGCFIPALYFGFTSRFADRGSK